LKRDRKRQLTRVAVADQSFVVKEYLSPGPWGVWAADCRSWLNSNRLSWYQIPAVRPFAFLHQPDGRGFLVLEDVGEQTLLHELRKEQVPAVRCKWLKAVAGLLASLHRFRIEHGDLKLANIMIRPQHDSFEIPLVLVDLDAVRFGVRMTIRQRAADLAQVLESLPGGQGSEPYRLLAEYRQAARLTRAELREVRDAL